jgi:hypothetical protein
MPFKTNGCGPCAEVKLKRVNFCLCELTELGLQTVLFAPLVVAPMRSSVGTHKICYGKSSLLLRMSL